MVVYYKNRKTGNIEGKFVGCDTKSSIFRDDSIYERIVSDEDLALDGTPERDSRTALEQISLKSPDGSLWQLSVDDNGSIKAARAAK